MKTYFSPVIIGICILVLGLGMNACKSKKATKSEVSSGVSVTATSGNLVDKKWKLIEINGVALSTMTTQPAVEAFIFFQANGNRVNGSSGCNNFTGTYKLDSGNQLHFFGVASTRKMCLDMTVEDQMNKIFQAVDSYTLQNGTLSLKQGEATLAKFVAE